MLRPKLVDGEITGIHWACTSFETFYVYCINYEKYCNYTKVYIFPFRPEKRGIFKKKIGFLPTAKMNQ